MSDGPHRTLNMRPRWKKVAEFADGGAYAAEDVDGVLAAACSQDWRIDVPENFSKSIEEILADREGNLFSDHRLARLEALRPSAAGHGLSQVLLDCALHEAFKAGNGSASIVDAATNALAIWSARHARQIEEHYRRKSTSPRATNVRARIESQTDRVSNDLARRILQDGHSAKKRPPAKQTGLDDGALK